MNVLKEMFKKFVEVCTDAFRKIVCTRIAVAKLFCAMNRVRNSRNVIFIKLLIMMKAFVKIEDI